MGVSEERPLSADLAVAAALTHTNVALQNAGSGAYIYRFTADNVVKVNKMLLMNQG